MKTFVIAAVAAALLASTSASFAREDSGRETYQSEIDFVLQQARQPNAVRDARAQLGDRQQNVATPFATGSVEFDRNVSRIER